MPRQWEKRKNTGGKAGTSFGGEKDEDIETDEQKELRNRHLTKEDAKLRRELLRYNKRQKSKKKVYDEDESSWYLG